MKRIVFFAVFTAVALSLSGCIDDIVEKYIETKEENFEWAENAYSQNVDNSWQKYSASGVFITTYKKGNNIDRITRDTVTTSANLRRSIVADEGWTAEQEKSTLVIFPTAQIEVLSVKDSSWTSGKYRWNAQKLTKRVKTTVRLADNSYKHNTWTVQEWANVSVVKDNKQGSFKNFDVKATHKSSQQKSDRKVMYRDTLYYNLGTNLQKSVGTGVINLREKKYTFPKEWGKIKNVESHHTINWERTAGIDTWCIGFENVLLPVRLEGKEPVFDFSLAEPMPETAWYSGATYNVHTGKLVPAHYSYEAEFIVYRRHLEENAINVIGPTERKNLGNLWNPEFGSAMTCVTKYSFEYKYGVLKVFFDGEKLYEFYYYDEEEEE